MSKLILRELTLTDEKAFLEGLHDWAVEERNWYTFGYKEGQSFVEHLEDLRKNKMGIDLKPGWVPSTMLYAFVENPLGESDNATAPKEKIVGRLSVRHTLNEFLFQRGGHLGYAVAPKYRRRGFATEILRQGIHYCRQRLNIAEILISCADTNFGSRKVIEACGGVLEKIYFDEQSKEDTRRYWVKK